MMKVFGMCSRPASSWAWQWGGAKDLKTAKARGKALAKGGPVGGQCRQGATPKGRKNGEEHIPASQAIILNVGK